MHEINSRARRRRGAAGRALSSSSQVQVKRHATSPSSKGQMTNSTHERLVKVAASVFIERGYHGATLDEIARRLDILKGSIYYYIRNKSDLLNQVITESGSDLSHRVVAVAKSDLPPDQKIREAIRIHLELFATRAPAFYVLLQDRLPIAPALRRRLQQQQGDYRAAWLEMIHEGIRTGMFVRDLDPKITFLAIIDMTTWAYRWYKKRGRLTAAQIAGLYADLVLRGMVMRTGQGVAEGGSRD